MSYIVNPRVIESRVGDGSNVKKSDVEYWVDSGVAIYGLVKESRVYDTDLSTVLKKSYTEYDLSSEYVASYVIGLPALTTVYGRDEYGLQLVAKTTHAYDEGNFSGSGQTITPVKHDGTNYGSSFTTGRGNLTSVRRWDVNYPTTESASTVSTTKYNTAGSVVSKTSPWYSTVTRTVTIGYTDNFNSSPGVSTYAYPTSVTDPNSQSSTVKYRYDIGANIEANSPAPAGQSHGKTSKRWFDSYGRMEKEAVLVNGVEQFYTRREFPTNGIQTKTYSTIVDTNATTSPGPDSADEILSESWLDGAGRVLRTRTEHPGSSGGWSATQVEYDMLGRVNRQSVPTEVSVSGSTWTPAGDDYTRGWLWSYQKYDWKSRVIRKINTDGDPEEEENDSDIFIAYEGCGCAGGQITTIRGELVPKHDVPTENARRTQKAYEDNLGRTYKTVELKWDGTTPYTTTELSFNGRDQVINSKQTDNTSTATPQTNRNSIMTYDGFGRPKTRKIPIEESGEYTEWIYNPDDSIQQIIDPRLAITNFTYNSRGLTTQISYDPPSTQPTYTTIDDTPTVTFEYDNLGNRTSMTDGSGSHTYAYDSLSRMTSETKSFTGLTGNFTISYGYQLSGKLKSITDPFGADVFYNDDKAGRTTSITGTDFLDVTTYASNIKFRAFGGVKEMTYGSADSSVLSFGFDERLRMNSYQSTSSVLSGGFVRKATYEYFADGRSKKVNNLLDSKFDHSTTYDHLGRITSSESGMATNNQEEEVNIYAQNMQYNAFGEITSRGTGVWGGEGGFTASYTDGRKQNSTEVYDASGNIVEVPTTNPNIYERWEFDAAGRNIETVQRWYDGNPQQTSFDRTFSVGQVYDGDGRTTRHYEHRNSVQVYPSATYSKETTRYFVRSSVMGGKILTELYEDGGKKVTNIYSGEGILAEQRKFEETPSTEAWSEVGWKHEDIVTGSYQKIARSGYQFASLDPSGNAEYEPLGGIIPEYDPSTIEPEGSTFPDSYRFGANVDNPQYGCELNGSPLSCNTLSALMNTFDNYRVGVRYQGDENYAWGLRQSILSASSLWRFDVYEEDKEGTLDTTADSGDIVQVETRREYIGSFYATLVSAEWLSMVLTQSQTNTRPLTAAETSKLTDARNRAIRELRDNANCRRKIAQLLGKVNPLLAPVQSRPLPSDTGGGGSQVKTFEPALTHVYDSTTGTSDLINRYNTATVLASGISGEQNGGRTFMTSSYNRYTGQGPININGIFFGLGLDARALHALHEIMHQHGSDVDFANAIAQITGDRVNNQIRAFTDDSTASRYLNDYLHRECGLPLE